MTERMEEADGEVGVSLVQAIDQARVPATAEGFDEERDELEEGDN